MSTYRSRSLDEEEKRRGEPPSGASIKWMRPLGSIRIRAEFYFERGFSGTNSFLEQLLLLFESITKATLTRHVPLIINCFYYTFIYILNLNFLEFYEVERRVKEFFHLSFSFFNFSQSFVLSLSLSLSLSFSFEISRVRYLLRATFVPQRTKGQGIGGTVGNFLITKRVRVFSLFPGLPFTAPGLQ